MDTSETYIKMSEKSPLQEDKILEDGDYITTWPQFRADGAASIISKFAPLGKNIGKRIKEVSPLWICLFRQDQLQAMVSDDIYQLLKDFSDWRLDSRISRYTSADKYNSMEQLWHAFVVQEKYGKVWDGGDWI